MGVGPVDARSPRYGIGQLDTVLDGLWWGDNVLWIVDDDSLSTDILLAEVIAVADGRDVSNRTFTCGVFDLRGDTSTRCLVDVACEVLRNGKTAVWICPRSTVPADLRELAQVIVDQSAHRLRIDRADGRRGRVVGMTMEYAVDDGVVAVRPPTTVSRLGEVLRSIRKQRGWSQADLAAMIGVSGSAISQTERGQQSLSLDTVIDLAVRLGVSVDHLVRGTESTYELVRPSSFGRTQSGSPQNFRIAPLATLNLSSASTGSVAVLVGSGVVKLEFADASVVLKPGDIVRTVGTRLRACQNLSTEPAVIFTVDE